jgi:putative PIN family toxin of toxin-antitoxin system
VSGEEAPPGAVYDCNVFLQGLAKEHGPAVGCMTRFESGAVRLFISRDLLEEIRDVLTRPLLQQKFPRLTTARVEALIEDLLAKAELIEEVPRVFEYERDPDDEPYVNLAIAARARYIVTRDNDLLALMDENRPEGRDFRTRFPGLSILDPVEFLRAITLSPEPERTQEPEREPSREQELEP